VRYEIVWFVSAARFQHKRNEIKGHKQSAVLFEVCDSLAALCYPRAICRGEDNEN